MACLKKVVFFFLLFSLPAIAQQSEKVEIVSYENEISHAYARPAQYNGQPGIAVIFEGTDDLHYYADKDTAPGGYYLKINAVSESLNFDKPVFPVPQKFFDPAFEKNLDVFVGNFTVFIPLPESLPAAQILVEIKITGIACTSEICLSPFEKTLNLPIDPAQSQTWENIDIAQATPSQQNQLSEKSGFSILVALSLALLAGLSLNIMPCVWPVLPIIVMRLVEQSRSSKGKSIALGATFSAGIIGFFVCLAIVNIILRLGGTVLQWGDQYRNPVFVTVMALLLVVLAMFMFGAFTITVPSSISGKASGGKGFAGAFGMGFLAAILSTPCSFAILAAAFAWAQSQPLALGTIAILFIGIGMALPYLILTSIPKLLSKTPKPGQWMEIFKQAIGFLLLLIAVKLITAVPDEMLSGVLYYSVVLAFCVWMWGGWVTFSTPLIRKIIIRLIAVAIAVWAAFFFFSSERIDWQPYDAGRIETAVESGQPVLIKFTADWCLNCEVADRLVFRKKDVAKLIEQKDVLAIKADTTNDGPANQALKNIYSEPGIPVTLLFIPEQEPVRWRGVSFADELMEHLKRFPDSDK